MNHNECDMHVHVSKPMMPCGKMFDKGLAGKGAAMKGQ